MLDYLYSVFSVPLESVAPVRLFHLLFRDFLVDPDKRGANPFWVDEKATHETIATRCLELLSSHLKEDICDLKMPGTARADVELAVIDAHLPADVRYACLYWVHHVVQSRTRMTDGHQTFHFLNITSFTG